MMWRIDYLTLGFALLGICVAIGSRNWSAACWATVAACGLARLTILERR